MPKEEWGTKRLCPTTGKRFFDLNKSPIISPYTGDVVSLDTGGRSRVTIAAKPEKKVVKEVAEPVAETDEVVEDDTDDADVDLNDDLLDDDDDDEETVPLDEIADVAKEEDDS